jgi:hypothetical protein
VKPEARRIAAMATVFFITHLLKLNTMHDLMLLTRVSDLWALSESQLPIKPNFGEEYSENFFSVSGNKMAPKSVC